MSPVKTISPLPIENDLIGNRENDEGDIDRWENDGGLLRND